MSRVKYFDTEGKPLKSTGDSSGDLRIPAVGAVLRFESCQAKVESVTTLAYGIDVIEVITRCRVLPNG
jgi:hypothetical protein